MMESIYVADKSHSELISLFNCDIENDDDFYDVLAYNIAQSNFEYLLSNISSFNNIRKRAAIFGLGFVESPKNRNIVIDTLKSFLSHNAPLLIAEAIDSLAQMEIYDCWKEIKSLSQHESEFVRGAVLRFASSALNQEALPLLMSALNDPHHIVRENAIDELCEIGDKTIVALIKPLLNDENEYVQQAAKSAVEQLLDES